MATSTVSNSFLGNFEVDNFKLGENEVEVRLGTTLIYPLDQRGQFFTIKALTSGTFKYSVNCSYAIDGGDFTQLSGNTNSPTITAGQTVMIYADASYSGVGKFSISFKYIIRGNLLSLIYGHGFYGQTTLTTPMAGMFLGETNLIDATNLALGATTINTSRAYQDMFKGCTNLVGMPQLPATTLNTYCYETMFSGCTSLRERTTLFNSSIYSVPYRAMYRMFAGCTSLRSANLGLSFPYGVVSGNTQAMEEMFSGCTNLREIKAIFNATFSGGTPTYHWVWDVPNTGGVMIVSSQVWSTYWNQIERPCSTQSAYPCGWEVRDESGNVLKPADPYPS